MEENGLSNKMEGLSRRTFLATVGATSALAATAVACRNAADSGEKTGKTA